MSAALAYGQACDVQAEIVSLSIIPDGLEPVQINNRLEAIDAKRRLLNATMTNLVKFEAELGLNPTSRSRIKLNSPQTKSRKERLLG